MQFAHLIVVAYTLATVATAHAIIRENPDYQPAGVTFWSILWPIVWAWSALEGIREALTEAREEGFFDDR